MQSWSTHVEIVNTRSMRLITVYTDRSSYLGRDYNDYSRRAHWSSPSFFRCSLSKLRSRLSSIFLLTTSEGMSLFFQCGMRCQMERRGKRDMKTVSTWGHRVHISCLFPIPLSRVRCKETGQQFHYCIVLWDQIYKVRLRAIYKTDHDTQSSSIARSWPIWPQIVRLRQGAKAT